MILTAENYFSREANMQYMSASQWKAFRKCEAAALAQVRGEYFSEATTAMLIGSYVDAAFEGTLDVFSAKHPELFKKDGTLKADYVHAQEIIARLEEDELYMLLMSGEKQVIKTGVIAGVPFKTKMDSLLSAEQTAEIAKRFPECAEALGFLDGAIVDQKIMRDMQPLWVEDVGRQNFVEAWGYNYQGAIYRAVDGRLLPFIIAAGTKEQACDLEAISIPDADLDEALAEVEETAPRYQAIKDGLIPPERCGKCPHCRATKKLTKIISWKELEV